MPHINITSNMRSRRGGHFVQPRRIGAYLEVRGEHGSTLTHLPNGGSFGFQVSRSVPCQHWLYVIEAVPDGLVKVGSTHQPAQRYKSLRKENRNRLMALACRALWPIGDMTRGAAVGHEYDIHADLRRRFCPNISWKGNRTSPEWYDAPLDEVIAIVESYVAHLNDSFLIGLA